MNKKLDFSDCTLKDWVEFGLEIIGALVCCSFITVACYIAIGYLSTF